MGFFQSFCHSHIFGQIWSQNLKFSKVELGTGVHCYMLITILMFIFPKFCHSCFWAYLVPQSGPNWLKFGAGIHHYMLITTLMFIFLKKFCHSCNFWQIWSQNLMLSQLTGIQHLCILLILYVDYNRKL